MAIFDLDGAPPPHVFALAPGRPFFGDLVAALLDDFGDVPETLADVEIFVPSRRAIRALKESFAQAAPGRTLLLPRMTAVADLSEDDAVSDSVEREAPPLPEAPSMVTKRLVLGNIYRDAQHQLDLAQPDWPSALRASGELSRISDQLTEYGIDSGALDKLLEDPRVAASPRHWRQIGCMLKLVTEAWPEWLSARGMIDGRDRRNRILSAVADRLETEGRAPLVLAAGFLGTTPSSEDFLRRVAALPRGAVILPALDRDLGDEAWQQIEAPHPQSAYRRLLREAFEGLDRRDVRPLPGRDARGASARRRLLSLALMPAEASHLWIRLFTEFRADPQARSALDGLETAVAPNMEDEADWIALTLREVLETPGRTGALVTADRNLARRVSAKLRGWGIELDDSGGKPLHGSYRATFLRLIARLMENPSDPTSWAGLIHHQLFGLAMPAETRRPLVQLFDRFLRGRPPRQGWEGLFASLDDDWRPFRASDEQRERIAGFIGHLQSVFQQHDPGPSCPLADRLRHHLTLATALAATPEEDGEERLFRFEDGEALERHFAALLECPEALDPIKDGTYPEVFDALLAMAPAYRPPGGQHPRLSVLGVLEARLQQADVLVVGGLQEGVWPSEEIVDPFLSRGMRAALGLPSPEAEVGRLAHDFLDFAAAPRVLLIRSERQGTSIARPSRFMVRLESFLRAMDGKDRSWDAAPRLERWQGARFSEPGVPSPAPRPQPSPPPELRPTDLSVSAIGKWLRDPYAIYAEKVLGLRSMARYDETFGPALKGMLLHAWAEEAVQMGDATAGRTIEEALDILRPVLLDRFDFPLDQRLLGTRFMEAMREVFPAFHRESLEHGHPTAFEVAGELSIPLGERTVTIKGRADRIDTSDNGPHLIDYKSGGTASLDETQHFSPQLFILALMMRTGSFPGFPPQEPAQVSFVTLKKPAALFGSSSKRSNKTLKDDRLTERLDVFRETFTTWLARQYRAETPFVSRLAPFSERDRGDYDDLARFLEWGVGGGDDD